MFEVSIDWPKVVAGVVMGSYTEWMKSAYRISVTFEQATKVGTLKPPVATFVAAYHPVQAAPYVFGFLLVGGLACLVASLHALAPAALLGRTVCALPLAGAFAALIVLNYALQTTMVPALAADPSPGNLALLAAVTMVNPRSLGWALEMWGYAVIGVATWLVAPVFDRGGIERTTAWLFVANGPFSVVGSFATAAWPGWVMTPAGLGAFAVWNVLIVAMTALAALAMRRRTEGAPSPHYNRRA